MTQRWNHSRDSYRPAGEPIDSDRYGVELIDSDSIARDFVRTHHYSGSYPAARCRVGLYRTSGLHQRELVGVAVFSVGAQSKALPKWAGTSDGVELGRFVLLDDVEANGETWFLKRAFDALIDQIPDCRAVLSYSDPMPRRRADGEMVTPGHIGTIYQAFNGRHVGTGKSETLWLDADGRNVSRRGLAKLKNGERGADSVYRRLIEAGAPAINRGESTADYIKRALVEGPFRAHKHPGNLAYVWALGTPAVRRRTARSFPPALPNPRRAGDPRNAQPGLF